MRRYGALISDLSICDIKLASVGFSSSRSYDGGRSGALLVSDARQEEDGEWQFLLPLCARPFLRERGVAGDVVLFDLGAAAAQPLLSDRSENYESA